MFSDKSGRNRHGHRLGKPAMHDPEDTEWGILSPRPLNRWTKRRPTKRIVVLLVFIFVAAVYSVRVWNEHQHFDKQKALAQQKQKQQQQTKLPPKPKDKPKEASQPSSDDDAKPPLFGKYHQAELAMPQHHVSDPFAGGKKYLWVENHVHGE